MPFYEYQCQACGVQTEALQKISDAPLKKCPDCGKSKLVKLVSAPVFRLKGSGWYETDFKGEGDRKRNLAGADAEPASASSADGDSKADAKVDAPKAESKAESKAKPKAKAKPVKRTKAKAKARK